MLMMKARFVTKNSVYLLQVSVSESELSVILEHELCHSADAL